MKIIRFTGLAITLVVSISTTVAADASQKKLLMRMDAAEECQRQWDATRPNTRGAARCFDKVHACEAADKKTPMTVAEMKLCLPPFKPNLSK